MNKFRYVMGLLPLAILSQMVCAIAGPELSVVVNGSPLQLNPPPIERAGRVFVPLRGIFENLGASVVYQSGTINATRNDRTVALHIGSNVATVSGVTENLDVAPFIVGASTYVPLRFVAQALGAQVNYDGNSGVVAVNQGGAMHGGADHGGPPPGPPQSDVQLQNLVPGPDAQVAANKPTIAADFNHHVDPNSLRMKLDGLDVSESSTRSETGVVYAPPSPLQARRHDVEITGRDAHGIDFHRHWAFESGTVARVNHVSLEYPRQGASVGSTFTVHGHSVPNARIHIIAGASIQVHGLMTMGTGNYTGDTYADQAGDFSQQVNVNTVSGGEITISVTATDPQTKATAQTKINVAAQ